MAKVQRITHVDDLTGLDIPEGEDVVNRELTWQGKAYELDLTQDSAVKVDAALEQIIKNATPVSKSGRAPRTAASRNESSQIREWARNQGLEVAARGRLNPAVIAAYRAGHVSDELRAAHAAKSEADKEADQAPSPEPEKPKSRSRSRSKAKAEEPEFAAANG
jgi:hypothetical protein